MAKKTKSKSRLDKYYYLAKTHGFRSRAAFKLIQLNKKYNFLSSATVLLDLCAAPGGWCQVASKEMPVSSIKIGIDLDPIKPIPGVTTFQCDITSEQCRHLIKKEIKHLKVDVVLHDGAPNVGGQWSKDSYGQNELVLYAIKLATEFLKEGGWFISKVFRSSDYNSLIYVMRQLFNKVEATKPQASRSQAAEIFVVCNGYKNPSSIDPKLLDPKFALKEIDDEEEIKNNSLKSIKAIFERKKNRSGYNNDTLYVVKNFKEFIECSNPYKFLFETNKIKIETEECKKYLDVLKPNFDYNLYFNDIQILGKTEFQHLIIWRNKIRMKLNMNRKILNNNNNEKKEKTIEDEMDEEIKKLEKQRKKKLENSQKKIEKITLKNKKNFIEQEDLPKDNEVDFDQNLFEYIQKNKIDIENIEDEKKISEDEKSSENEEKNLGKYDEINLSSLDESDYIDMLNDDIEENKRLFEEEKGRKSMLKEIKNSKKKNKNEIKLVENENQNSIDEEDFKYDGDNEEEEESGDHSSFYEDDNDDDNDVNNIDNDLMIKNPLRKNKEIQLKENDVQNKEKNSEDNLSSDSEIDNEKIKYKNNNIDNDNKLLNKKTKRNNDNKLNNLNDNKKDDNSEKSSSEDGYNTDEKAEIRAIATKMLRKKDRINILNSSYNRYAFEDNEKVPKWFKEDENLHNVPLKPVTKEEILREKEYLRKINARMPKKILEAKARKRNKLQKRLQKIKKKAENIANQDEYNEISKVKQIEKLYRKEISKTKEKKRYIISRSYRTDNRKNTRTIKHVDRRMKKDKRAIKARDKRNKKYKRKRH